MGGKAKRLLQRFAVQLNRNAMGTLAIAQEVFSEEKYAWMIEWLNNSANRYKSLRR